MHPKTTKLYKSLDHLGFWQEGLGYKDIYGGNKQQDQLVNLLTFSQKN